MKTIRIQIPGLVLVAGLYRPDSLTRGNIGIGIGKNQTSSCEEGLYGLHWTRRFLLHNHSLEHPGDSGGFEGLLRSGS